jgi:hypothetical protein
VFLGLAAVGLATAGAGVAWAIVDPAPIGAPPPTGEQPASP